MSDGELILYTTEHGSIENSVVSHWMTTAADNTEKLALERQERFDAARRESEQLMADAKELEVLEQAEQAWEAQGSDKQK